jgi:hypothetical protein
MDINEYLDMAIANWRKKRDEAFAKHGLNVQEVYAAGNFEELPPECFMAVCYVDAFNCVKASIASKGGD